MERRPSYILFWARSTDVQRVLITDLYLSFNVIDYKHNFSDVVGQRKAVNDQSKFAVNIWMEMIDLTFGDF